MLMADWRDSATGLITSGDEAHVNVLSGFFWEMLLVIMGLRAADDSETRTAHARLRRIEMTTKQEM